MFTFTRRCARAANAVGVILLAFVGAAHGQASPNPVSQGWNAAKYGNCRADVLMGDPRLHAATAVIGALSNAASDRLYSGPDPLDWMVKACGQQLSHHRCSDEIVSLLGEIHQAALEVGLGVKVPEMPKLPDKPVVAGAAVGGTIGLGVGVMRGRPISTAIKGAMVGAAVGGVAATAQDHWPQARCLLTQRKLGSISAGLQARTVPASQADMAALIAENLRSGALSQEEADMLLLEAAAMVQRSSEIVRIMRGP